MAADNPFDFSGRRALVTGAASGIGAACARWLDRHGVAGLVLVDRDGDRLKALDLGCAVTPIVGDVADESLWEGAGGALAGLDHAVINAGVSGPSTPIVDTSFAAWRATLSVNLDGAFLGLRAAMRAMGGPGSGRGGSVVLTASVSGLRGIAPAAYGTSKAALIHLARTAAREGGTAGIRVNAIAPAGVDTPIWDDIPQFAEQAAREGRAAAIAAWGATNGVLGRFAGVDEIAAQIGFLLSPLAATITGTTLVSDGGFTI